ncbi:mitochondrial carrier [Violaceomyces palustris]|uniref:Mitochondrial carrier n=1 Tax=Violaceomyces palustris TaxID=1673888 RepID=A0ACD0P405_9BASI|nr:mitochondrial carrier [Violaceomyces palustris]
MSISPSSPSPEKGKQVQRGDLLPPKSSTRIDHQDGKTTSTLHRKTKPSSRSNKVIAAVAGAVTTSFLMTPFDVVKTRLQTQSNAEPLFVPSAHLSSTYRVQDPSSSRSAFPSAVPSSSSSTNHSSGVTAKQAPSVSPLNQSYRFTAHPATCCQQTFFSANSQESSITCRYDPRVGAPPTTITTNHNTGRGSGGGLSSSSKNSRVFTKLNGPFSQNYSRASAFSQASLPKGWKRILPNPPRILTKNRNPANQKLMTPNLISFSANASSSSTCTAACAFPDKMIAEKELQAAAGRNGRLTGLWDGMIKVGRTEGVRGLWRGLSPTLMMTVPSQVTYMTCYDYFRSSMLRQNPADQDMFPTPPLSASDRISPRNPSLSAVTAHSLYVSLLAGGMARGISATLVTPLELVRTQLQATSFSSSSTRGNSNNLTTILKSLRLQMRRQGPLVLWRGLSPTLWRDVPFSAIYFAGYETCKRILTGGGLGEEVVKSNGGGGKGEEFTISFLSGALSGTIASLVTHPFDLVKTRLQASRTLEIASPPTSSSPNTPLSGSLRKTNSTNNPGVFRVMTEIYRNEGGFQALFRGLSPRVAKVSPACGIMIGVYELSQSIL